MKISDKDLLNMLKIRQFELTLLDLFKNGVLHGTVHTCLGQEYIPVALTDYVRSDDLVISTHRGHGHMLSFTGNINGLFAELLGKNGAMCSGKGGSQHLMYQNVLTTGIQGEGVSVALGTAWSMKRDNKGSLTYVFAGDGTMGRGSVYESMNMAALYSLPYILIVENNGIAMTTKLADNMSGTVENRAKAFGMDYISIKSNAPDEIRELLEKPINKVRSHMHPLLIEFDTVRIAAHSKGDDTRSDEELNLIKKKYWYEQVRAEDAERIAILEKEAREFVEQELQGVLLRETILG